MRYAADVDQQDDFRDDEPRTSKVCLLLLILPVLALAFPGLYNRDTPGLLGFPFFYWYQLAWVVLTTAILGAVYKLQKRAGR